MDVICSQVIAGVCTDFSTYSMFNPELLDLTQCYLARSASRNCSRLFERAFCCCFTPADYDDLSDDEEPSERQLLIGAASERPLSSQPPPNVGLQYGTPDSSLTPSN